MKPMHNRQTGGPAQVVAKTWHKGPASQKCLTYKKGSTTPFLIGLPLPSTVLPSAL